jgi:hypothetical protein
MSCERETAVIPRSDGWADGGPREAQAHPGIHGSYHRHDVIEWFEPSTCEYTADHARPICPVGELASADSGSACRLICERIGIEAGSGAWRCPHHGYFRVFGYPAEREQKTEQATLLTDGGQATDAYQRDPRPVRPLESSHSTNLNPAYPEHVRAPMNEATNAGIRKDRATTPNTANSTFILPLSEFKCQKSTGWCYDTGISELWGKSVEW